MIKTPEQVERMRISGALLSRCLDLLKAATIPGRSSQEIDTIAEEFIRDHGAVPAFKNYHPVEEILAYPGTICFSRNHVIVHGVPSDDEIVEEGDIITIDCGLSLDGWFADAARLFGVGEITPEDVAHIQATEETLNAGIEACVTGNTIGMVSNAIQNSVGWSPYYNVIEFCGHSIGQSMHEPPQVPNCGIVTAGPTLAPGMVLCLEPMLKRNNVGLGVLPDRWTVVTLDGSRVTHIEHMVLVTESTPEILTL
jgi:methionyl aminopeptidase